VLAVQPTNTSDVIAYWQSKIVTLEDELVVLMDRIASLESMRPVWAQGHSSDSIAAQVSSAALAQIWDILGVTNQTEAVAKLEIFDCNLREITSKKI
jgi:hypothetical protein